MRIRYVTPTGAVCEAVIASPGKELPDWKLKGYVRQELKNRFIEFKSFTIR